MPIELIKNNRNEIPIKNTKLIFNNFFNFFNSKQWTNMIAKIENKEKNNNEDKIIIIPQNIAKDIVLVYKKTKIFNVNLIN